MSIKEQILVPRWGFQQVHEVFSVLLLTVKVEDLKLKERIPWSYKQKDPKDLVFYYDSFYI